MDDIDGAVLENRFGTGQRHGIGDLGFHFFFNGGRFTLGGGDHDLFARTDNCAGAGENPFLAVLLDALEVIDPFILASHRVQPIAAAADAEIANATLNTRIDGGNIDS